MIEEKHEKPVRLIATVIWTRDLPNANTMSYHEATSLGEGVFHARQIKINWETADFENGVFDGGMYREEKDEINSNETVCFFFDGL